MDLLQEQFKEFLWFDLIWFIPAEETFFPLELIISETDFDLAQILRIMGRPITGPGWLLDIQL